MSILTSFLRLFRRKLTPALSVPTIVPREPEMTPIIKPGKYFTLGIDFGTHGSKIAYREPESSFDSIKLVVLDGAGSEGRAEHVFPSIVTVQDGRIYFGKTISDGEKIENFKRRIGECAIEMHSGLTYENITILYLAFVLCESVRQIEVAHHEYKCKVMLNLSAPFSDLQERCSAKTAYDRILKIIWRLYWNHANEIKQGMHLGIARRLIASLKYNTINNEENWRWLVPEIQAVITAFAQSTDIPPYSYHIVVDVGGFTTDFSIFNVGDPSKPQASIFASKVIKEGIIAYDECQNKQEFCESLRRKIFDVIEDARKRKILNPGQFVNFDRKALWRIGGGFFRSDFLDILLNSELFLSGFGNLDRTPNFFSNKDDTRMFLVAKGLTTFHSNLINILQAKPLQVFQPPTDNRLPYHMQDHN